MTRSTRQHTRMTARSPNQSARPRLRLLAFALCLPAIYGAWLLVDPDDFTSAMAWLLIPAAAAGLALSSRFYPLRLTDAELARIDAAFPLGPRPRRLPML